MVHPGTRLARPGSPTRGARRAGTGPVTPSVLAVAALTAAIGIAVAVLISPHAWAVDADRNLAAARALLAGEFGVDRGYLYSPLAAALTVPATWLPAGLAIALWFVARLTMLVAAAAALGRDLAPGDRWLAVVAVVLFVPCVLDLSLGNVSILLAGAILVVANRRDGWWTGVFIGLALATVPKPQLLPLLAWMVLYRPQATIGALGAAVASTAAGVLLLGLEPYAAWIDVLRAPEYLVSGSNQGNLAIGAWLSSTAPAFTWLALPLGMAAALGAVLGLLRGPWPGLVACLCLGLLVAPYTMAYGAVLLLPAVRPLAIAAPRRLIGLAIAAPVGIVVAFPLWVGAVLVAAISVPSARWAAVPFERPAGSWTRSDLRMATRP